MTGQHRRLIGRAAVFALVVSPVCGIVIGALIALCQFLVNSDLDLLFLGIFYAIVFGSLIGFVFGVLLAVPVSFLRLHDVLIHLSGGAIVGGISLALLVNDEGAGLLFGALGAIVGFWCGAATLLGSYLLTRFREGREN